MTNLALMIQFTITSLMLTIGAIAIVLTAMVFYTKQHKNLFVSYLQNFCGALFIFSGFVKADDPLGTAFKMEQYFAEFESTFAGSSASFLAPLFPALSKMSDWFSIFMIVLELVIGAMLIFGVKNKITSWLFLLIMIFFTVLTGYTYLTAYVPSGVNFFDFGSWDVYKETNMKVTDCGCFGDFLKLKPKISFFKDIFLMFPALFFLFRHKDMHELFTSKLRSIFTWATLIFSTLFCLRNTYWNEPPIDFRPFYVGQNIRERKAAEEDADAKAPVTYVLTNKTTQEVKRMPMDEFLKVYASYPKEQWTIDQDRAEPTVPRTKISDFAVQGSDGGDVTEQILSEEGYSLMIVAYKLKYSSESTPFSYQDTTFAVDTIIVKKDTSYQRRVANVETKQGSKDKFIWDEHYLDIYRNKVNPVLDAAEKAGVKVFGVTKFADPAMLDDFRHNTQSAYPFYTADDILLKTILRSNPGIVLLKNGEVINKWHYRHLPDFENIKSMHLK